MPLSTFATTCGPPCRRTYTETFFVWPVLPLPHPTYMRSQGRSRLALLSFSVFLPSLLSPSPNPNPARRVGSTAAAAQAVQARRSLCNLCRRRFVPGAGGGGEGDLIPQVCTSIGVHGRGLSKMIDFPATGEPCGSSSSAMAGNKAR